MPGFYFHNDFFTSSRADVGILAAAAAVAAFYDRGLFSFKVCEVYIRECKRIYVLPHVLAKENERRVFTHTSAANTLYISIKCY